MSNFDKHILLNHLQQFLLNQLDGSYIKILIDNIIAMIESLPSASIKDLPDLLSEIETIGDDIRRFSLLRACVIQKLSLTHQKVYTLQQQCEEFEKAEVPNPE